MTKEPQTGIRQNRTGYVWILDSGSLRNPNNKEQRQLRSEAKKAAGILPQQLFGFITCE
jgi:hypothetical protein